MSDLLDTLSRARTALDDPSGLGDEYERLKRSSEPDDPFVLYAIDRLDDAIGLLDPEKPSRALATIGDLVAQIADSLRGGEKGGDEVEHPAHDLDEAVQLIESVADRFWFDVTD